MGLESVLPTVCARTPETDFTSPASHPFKVRDWVTSLALQWLRLCLPMQKAWVQSLVEELQSHVPWGQVGVGVYGQNYLCYTIGLGWFSILNTAMCS